MGKKSKLEVTQVLTSIKEAALAGESCIEIKADDGTCHCWLQYSVNGFRTQCVKGWFEHGGKAGIGRTPCDHVDSACTVQFSACSMFATGEHLPNMGKK